MGHRDKGKCLTRDPEEPGQQIKCNCSFYKNPIMMESTNYNKQYHQPWMANHLYYKEYTDLVNPMRNSVSWKQVWTSETEPIDREIYDSYVKPVPLQVYRYSNTLQACVNEAHTRCLPQHLPSTSPGITFDHSFPIPCNYIDNIQHKDVVEDVTSQWITHGTELIKVATIPISNSFHKAPWNDIHNLSEAVRDYECDIVDEQPQHISCGNPIPEVTRDIEKVENSTASSDSKIEDSCSITMSSSSIHCNSGQSNIMDVSETIEEECKNDKVSNCSSPNTAQTKSLQCQAQETEDACCTEEESNFLLIDDRGIPYTVFKEDYLSSIQGDDLDDPRRLHYCPICFRSFLYLSDLERHSITHSERKPYDCKVCGKTFKRSSHLQRHKHIHTGERPFLCNVCRKGFRESGELQRHQRVHTGEKPYQCEICYVRFTERNTLRRHTKRKHTIQALLKQDAAGSTDWEAKLMRSIVDDSAL